MRSLSTPTDVIEYVAKYMQILGVNTPPEIKIANNIGSPWLGTCRWVTSRPETTTITLQKQILSHSTTMERVVAHEMVHHWELLSLTPAQVSLLRIGINPTSHGAKFQEGASKINAIIGPDFVTPKSDSSYELSANTKEFYLLICPVYGRDKQLGWAWCVRPSQKIKDRITQKCTQEGAKVIMTSDERWTVGEKIKAYGGFSVPRPNSELKLELEKLFNQAPSAH